MPRARGGKKIDFVHWTGFAGGALAFAAGTIAVNLFPASHLKETLLRTRGSLLAFIDGASAPAKLARVGVGMLLVPEGTGTTVLSSPLSEPDAPWFWVSEFLLGYEEMVTDVIDVLGLSSYREIIDSKAMRKIPSATEVQLVMENVTVGTAVGVNIQVVGRALTGT